MWSLRPSCWSRRRFARQPSARPLFAAHAVLLGDEGLAGAGVAARAAVEARTDELAGAPWTVLSSGELERLLGLLHSLVAALAGPEGISYPDDMGVLEPA